MADYVMTPYHRSGQDLYLHVRDLLARLYNGTGLETYDAGNWLDYCIATSEQGNSRVYIAEFPGGLAAGVYVVTVYRRVGATRAESDDVVAHGVASWDGSNLLDLSGIIDHGDAEWAGTTPAAVAQAVLATPAQKLATNASGHVTVENTAGIASAVWGAATRELTGFGTLVSDVATAVWSAGARTLTSFGFTVTTNRDAELAVIHTTATRLGTAIQESGGAWRFTSAALEQSPGGDATEANQTSILATLAALENASVGDVVDGVLDAVIDGDQTVQDALAKVLSKCAGRVVKTNDNPVTLQYYDWDGANVLFTLVVPTSASNRTRT